jgi:signal transduction histidine kinase
VKRRLYLQIYAAFVLVSLLWFATAAVAVRMVYAQENRPPVAETLKVIGDQLPADGTAGGAVDDLAERLDLRVSLYDSAGELIARAGGRLPAPDVHGPTEILLPAPNGQALAVELADGRWLVAAPRGDRHKPKFIRFILVLALTAGGLSAGSWFVARRITRRLETLQAGADRLASGELAARVPVEGDDEVAEVARSFNRAADRIETLVDGQRRMLASASHELRSPLARLRLAVEMLAADDPARQALASDAARDVAELDELIGDLLLASRLEAAPLSRVDADVHAIVVEEAARVGATVTGEPTVASCDPKAVRHLVRNLLENARRHGAPPIEATVGRDRARVRITVSDRGPGVGEADRERIWEPFWRPAGHAEGGGGGVGLGLALVRQVARRHGGDAVWSARDGGGSVFVATLSC